MMTATTEETHSPPLDVRKDCICPNGGRHDQNGILIISPCCRFHYAERTVRIARPDLETEVTDVELAEWRKREKKRVAYPKLAVAKR